MEVRTEQALMAGWGARTEPLVSIVCLTYNHEPYLRETLEGFLRQETDFPFEVIVHDDASTDSTARIIRDYAARYPAIIRPIYQQQNQYRLGTPFSTRLFAQARGKYIAYCEGDDYWTDPRKLQIQVDFLEQHREYVITYHDAYRFNSQGVICPVQFTGRLRGDASARELQRGRPLSTLTTCFRNVLHDLPRELHGVELLDICWWSLLGAYGKGKFLGEIQPAAYRIHEGGVFSMRSSRQRIWMALHAYHSLARYYHRMGDEALCDHFLIRVFGQSLALIGPSRKLRALTLVCSDLARNLLRRLSMAGERR